MLKAKVRDIEILYDDEDSAIIDSIKLVIDLNYQMFLASLKKKRTIALFESNDPDVYVMNDFEEEFYKIMKHFMECEDIKDILENASFLDWYLYFYSANDSNISTNIDIGYELEGKELSEIFTLLIRYRYYKAHDNLKDFYHNHLSGCDADEVINWMQDELRFPLYNELMKMMVNEISTDRYFFKNFGRMYLLLIKEVQKEVDKQLVVDLPPITLEEINKYMYEFFDYIHAPDSWKEKYNEIKLNDRLILLDEENVDIDDKDAKTSFLFEEDIPKIQLVRTGKIDDFTSFVHEFIHYLKPVYTADVKRLIIRELPSIYFEIMAGMFLIKKGYTKDIVKYVYQIHRLDNAICSFDTSVLVYRLLDYIQNGDTSELREFNDIIEQGERSIRLDTYDFLSDDVDEIREEIKNRFDEINKRLLNFGILSLSGIHYVLAMLIIDNINLEDVIPNMIDIGENLDEYDLEEVLNIFQFNLFNCEENVKKKVKSDNS